MFPHRLQTIKDGKPIIIEGLHLDPGLYLDEFGRHGMIGMGGAFSLELPPDATATAALLGVQAAQEKVRGPALGLPALARPWASCRRACVVEGQLPRQPTMLPSVPVAAELWPRQRERIAGQHAALALRPAQQPRRQRRRQGAGAGATGSGVAGRGTCI